MNLRLNLNFATGISINLVTLCNDQNISFFVGRRPSRLKLRRKLATFLMAHYHQRHDDSQFKINSILALGTEAVKSSRNEACQKPATYRKIVLYVLMYGAALKTRVRTVAPT